jgi:hypothetical protein
LTGARRLLYVPAEPRSKNWITSVELTFARSVLTIAVNPDYDTLVLRETPLSGGGSGEAVTNAMSRAPWRRWIGEQLRFSWICINQQGYVDALQFGFESHRPSVSLVATASAIYEYVVTPVRMNPRVRRAG